MRLLVRLALFTTLCALAACASTPVESPTPAVPQVAPEQRLSAVIAAAGADDRELAVQPLRDPEVEDLRITATRAVATRDYASAADALNQALLIVADDPAVLQERAEVALLQSDFARAETLSQRALELGSKVGPLCRRHWATVEQARLALGRAEPAASAHAQIETCTVAGLLRM
jgi:Flp pilus assembly protein TadD